jgi:hypothetical protein
VTGLAYQFRRFILVDACPACARKPGENHRPLSWKTPGVTDLEAPIGPDEFAVCSFNLENLFDDLDDGDGDMGDWAPASSRV